MATKDYYAVLQVQPSAEAIVIEAAYKRLAREYHPDVYGGMDAHDRIVALNEAWEVLGDRDSRKEYDKSLTVSSRKISTQAQHENSRTRTEEKYRATAPTPPNSRDFGIDPKYFDKAVEGARAWKKRRKLLPDVLQAIIFFAFAGAGVLISLFESAPELAPIKSVASFGWIVGLVLGYMLSFGVQQLHDKHLLNTEFNPRYNPNPLAYAKYAEAVAEYEAEISDVHLTRTGSCYHSKNYCSGTMGTYDLPRYEAIARGYRPCSHCGYFKIRTKPLPSPFGQASLPEGDG